MTRVPLNEHLLMTHCQIQPFVCWITLMLRDRAEIPVKRNAGNMTEYQKVQCKPLSVNDSLRLTTENIWHRWLRCTEMASELGGKWEECLVSLRISNFTRAWFDPWLQLTVTKNAKGYKSRISWRCVPCIQCLGEGENLENYQYGQQNVKKKKKKKTSLSLAFQVTVFESAGNICLASTTKLCQWPHKNYYCWPSRNRKYKYLKFQRLKGMNRDLWGSAAAYDVSE